MTTPVGMEQVSLTSFLSSYPNQQYCLPLIEDHLRGQRPKQARSCELFYLCLRLAIVQLAEANQNFSIGEKKFVAFQALLENVLWCLGLF